MERLERPHKWFAWRPVTIFIRDDGRQVKAWLEYVERTGRWIDFWDGGFWTWKYKFLSKGK